MNNIDINNNSKLFEFLNNHPKKIDAANYTDVSIIATTDSGIVLQGTDKQSKKKVAIKIFLGPFFEDEEHKRVFIDNLNDLEKLNMPGILKFYGFCPPLSINAPRVFHYTDNYGYDTTSRTFYPIIFTEFNKNGNILNCTKNYIQTSGKECTMMNPTIRSKIVFGVAAIMKKIHSKKIIFQNLRLERIYLDDNLEPVIGGFGFIPPFSTNTELMKPKGKPFYYPPEIIEGKPINFSVDVYTYAIVLYQLFSGDLKRSNPYRTIINLFQAISSGKRFKRPNSIPDSYWDLIQKCWAQDPEQRPTFEEITEELKSDRFILEEFGMKTNIDEFHLYQEKIDK